MKFFQAQQLVLPLQTLPRASPRKLTQTKQQTDMVCFHSKVTLTHVIVCSEVCKKIEELDPAPPQMKFVLHC